MTTKPPHQMTAMVSEARDQPIPLPITMLTVHQTRTRLSKLEGQGTADKQKQGSLMRWRLVDYSWASVTVNLTMSQKMSKQSCSSRTDIIIGQLYLVLNFYTEHNGRGGVIGHCIIETHHQHTKGLTTLTNMGHAAHVKR